MISALEHRDVDALGGDFGECEWKSRSIFRRPSRALRPCASESVLHSLIGAACFLLFRAFVEALGFRSRCSLLCTTKKVRARPQDPLPPPRGPRSTPSRPRRRPRPPPRDFAVVKRNCIGRYGFFSRIRPKKIPGTPQNPLPASPTPPHTPCDTRGPPARSTTTHAGAEDFGYSPASNVFERPADTPLPHNPLNPSLTLLPPSVAPWSPGNPA